MNMGLHTAQAFLTEFKQLVKEEEKKDFIFFPPAFLSFLFQKESFFWGAQNVHSKEQGAYTGENSISLLKEMGAKFCLIGHSERRLLFGEQASDIEKKFSLAQKYGLIPLVCIGETLEQRFDKKKFLLSQISWIKKGFSPQNLDPANSDFPVEPHSKLCGSPDKSADFSNKTNIPKSLQDIPFIVAYEPVWSIGTGQTPSLDEIEQTAGFLKEQHPNIKVFYGGSVSPANAKNFCIPNLDGLLVGGASLKARTLYKIHQQIRLSNS